MTEVPEMPLSHHLMRIGMELMKAYQHDIVIDCFSLADTVPGDKFLWGVRETGTYLCNANSDNRYEDPKKFLNEHRLWNHKWYRINVTKRNPQSNFAYGTIEEIK